MRIESLTNVKCLVCGTIDRHTDPCTVQDERGKQILHAAICGECWDEAATLFPAGWSVSGSNRSRDQHRLNLTDQGVEILMAGVGVEW